jgi:hypothetical protein
LDDQQVSGSTNDGLVLPDLAKLQAAFDDVR